MKTLLTGIITLAGQEIMLHATKGDPRWERKNFRGKTVNLSGGTATAGGAIAVALTAPKNVKFPALLMSTVAAVTGIADDFDRNPGQAKGLRGHLNALRRGKVTTGAIKLLGISGAGIIAGGVIARQRGSTGLEAVADCFTSGAVIAGAANLVNLLDLRPGRALKAVVVSGAALSNTHGGHCARGALTLALVAGTRDLQEETMLGDVGANSLGALIGLAVVSQPSWRVRLSTLGAITGLVLASEKVSFSRVIEQNRALTWFDQLGRRP